MEVCSLGLLDKRQLFLTLFQSTLTVFQVSRTGKLAARCHQLMSQATTYSEWREASLKLAKLLHLKENYSTPRDRTALDILSRKIKSYEELLSKEDVNVDLLRHHLRSDLLRKNVGHSTGNPLVKERHQHYQKLQLQALNRLAVIQSKEYTGNIRFFQVFACLFDITDVVDELQCVRDRLAFFKETKQSYGNSALLLSGGATLGLLHTGISLIFLRRPEQCGVGVVKTLFDQGLLPKILGGSSAGALVAAMVGKILR